MLELVFGDILTGEIYNSNINSISPNSGTLTLNLGPLNATDSAVFTPANINVTAGKL